LVQPALDLAANGFPVSWGLAQSLQTKLLGRFADSRRIFQRDGRFYEMGETLVQPELAATLARIAREGSKDFYEGETARRLAADMAAHGGLITLDDLNQYRAVEREPLRGAYRGHELITAPPPSSGGVGVIQMLHMLEGSGFEKAGAGSAAAIHYMAEVMRRFFADRARYFGDPDFVKVPVAELTARQYAERRRISIRPDRATPSAEVSAGPVPGFEGAETTHYSIVDEAGNAVAVTYTLNGSYGSGVTASGLGFLLNNEMDDLTAKPGTPNAYGLIQGEANAIAPGKRPLSSMTPTIVTRHGKLELVLGSPGGPTIINTVLQVLVNVVDFGMNVQQAVDWPRFHHQWLPDELRLERYGTSPDTIALLRAKGHEIRFVERQGDVAAIHAQDGWLLGAADPRGEGTARGY
jgi:gamma-glutamyltranspeptidase/glutathione hydrolase